MTRGYFGTVEGGDGAGKSSQILLLEDYLKQQGYKVFVTREPGGEPVAEKIRELILDPKNKTLNDTTELLLFLACRSQFMKEIVIPKLHEGYFVLSSRSGDSTKAYQGYGRGIDVSLIDNLNQIVTRGVTPDITCVIDVSPKIGLSKVETEEFGEKDRIEAAGINYHERVNNGFLELAKQEPGRIKVVSYIENGIDEMQTQIRSYFDEFLRNKK
ncbi:dTMP kinase [Nanoarchaeota archaeon]